MIPKLLSEGHKILIFTQFVLMLDIIGEFLDYKKFDYERLDGTTRNIDRQKIIDNFNNGHSKIFILSTRAGGLGINLTSSDTVIFVDSDFNPYQDIQAFCRAYRIGQKNKVMVYRLVSKFTVEEKIVENATKKLMMGEMIMNPIDQSKSDKGVIESMLRYGTKELFEQASEGQENEEITEEKLEELLQRDSKGSEVTKKVMKSNSSGLSDYYLSGFNFTDFNFTPILETNISAEETKENKYWETLLGQDYLEYEKKNVEDLGKGKRTKRTATTFNGSDSDSRESIDIEIPIEISAASQDEGDALYNTDSEYDIGNMNKKNKNAFVPSSDEEELTMKEKLIEYAKDLPKELQEFKDYALNLYLKIKDFNLEQLFNQFNVLEPFRIKMVELVLKYGLSKTTYRYMNMCLYDLEISNGIKIKFSPENEWNKGISCWNQYLTHFYSFLTLEKDLSTSITEFFFSNIHPYAIRKRILGFINLRGKLTYFRKKIDKFKLAGKEYTHLISKEISKGWKNTDDFYLLEGINHYGFGEWEKILTDTKLWDHFEPKVLQSDQVWKAIFFKIEEREVDSNQENECYEFVLQYVKIRGCLLMDSLANEKEKKRLPRNEFLY